MVRKKKKKSIDDKYFNMKRVFASSNPKTSTIFYVKKTKRPVHRYLVWTHALISFSACVYLVNFHSSLCVYVPVFNGPESTMHGGSGPSLHGNCNFAGRPVADTQNCTKSCHQTTGSVNGISPILSPDCNETSSSDLPVASPLRLREGSCQFPGKLIASPAHLADGDTAGTGSLAFAFASS